MTYGNEHLLAILSVACWLAGTILGYGIRWVQEGWRKPDGIVNEDYGYPFYRRSK